MSNRMPIVTTNIYAKIETPKLSDPEVLIIGQSFGKGATTPGKIMMNVRMNQIEELLGNDSELGWAVKTFKKHNKVTKVDVLPLANPSGGTPGVAGITFAGTATEDGEIEFRPFDDAIKVKLPVYIGDKHTDLSVRLDAIIKEEDKKIYYPFTTAVDNATVNITTKTFGIHLNGLEIRVRGRVAGISVSTFDVSGASGSYGNLDLPDKITKRYHYIVFGSSDHYDDVADFLEARFNGVNRIDAGIGIVTWAGEPNAARQRMETLNYKTIVNFANFKGRESKYNCMPILLGTQAAAKWSLLLTEGADLSDLVVSPLSNKGGAARAALALHRIPLDYLNSLDYADTSSAQLGRQRSLEDQKELNKLGFSCLADTNSGYAEFSDIVTSYKLNKDGFEDDKFHYLEYVLSSLVVKEYFFNKFKTQFAQTNIVVGDVREGVDEIDVVGLKAAIIGWYKELIDMAVVDSGTESFENFKNTLSINIDRATGRISIDVDFTVVAQIRSITMNLYLTFRG